MKIETENKQTQDAIRYEEMKLENLKEMLKESEEQLDGLTRGRELLDQKITHFLGILLLVLSSVTGFGFKSFLKMSIEKDFLFLGIFLGFVGMLCGLSCLMIYALLPKKVYLKGNDPMLFWKERWIIKSTEEMIFSICKNYGGGIEFIRKVIAKKAKILTWSVYFFSMVLFCLLISVVCIPTLASKAVYYLKAG